MSRRRWPGWVILEPDETFYRFSREDPAKDEALQNLIRMRWHVIPVDVVERPRLPVPKGRTG